MNERHIIERLLKVTKDRLEELNQVQQLEDWQKSIIERNLQELKSTQSIKKFYVVSIVSEDGTFNAFADRVEYVYQGENNMAIKEKGKDKLMIICPKTNSVTFRKNFSDAVFNKEAVKKNGRFIVDIDNYPIKSTVALAKLICFVKYIVLNAGLTFSTYDFVDTCHIDGRGANTYGVGYNNRPENLEFGDKSLNTRQFYVWREIIEATGYPIRLSVNSLKHLSFIDWFKSAKSDIQIEKIDEIEWRVINNRTLDIKHLMYNQYYKALEVL